MIRFSPLRLDDYERLKGLLAGRSHPHSEYSLSGIILWNDCVRTAGWAQDGDLLFFCETALDDPQERFLLLPVSSADCPPALLRDKAVEAGFCEYRFVHEGYVARWGLDEVGRYFALAEQPGYNDYVYLAQSLAELGGPELARKRVNVRRFEKECALDGLRVETERLSSANAAACASCLEEWSAQLPPRRSSRLLECERRAILAALKEFDRLELSGVMVRIAGAVEGFAIASRLSDDTGVLHFEKASGRRNGLYQYLDQACAHLLRSAGAAFINKEGDQDDPGLARAKQSYRPVRRVPAYRLRLRP